MLFFKSLAVLSTLAFGAISSLAAPAGTTETGLVARCDCDKPIPAILADVQADISVGLQALTFINKDNCTAEAITPIIADIKAHINVGIVAIGKLAGQPLDVVIGANVSVDVFAGIVADLIISIFAAVRVVLNLGVSLTAILPILCGLGEVVGALIVAILNVCAGLFVGLDVAIYALINVCVDVIVKLNVSVLISVFGIVV